MRHKYATPALVLARVPIAEAGMLVTLLTPELGLIRARAEGVRRSGAKLAHALQALNESDIMLVRGKEGWRVTGAVLAEDRFVGLGQEARARIARVSGLLLRLVHGESDDPSLHTSFTEFLLALGEAPSEEGEAVESLVVLRLLSALGLDAGELPPPGYGPDARVYVTERRAHIISRINRGIAASSL
ncbi:MAG: DNA repair protein RecO [Bacillota bacterium]